MAKCDGRNSRCPKNEYCADQKVVRVLDDDDFTDVIYYDDGYYDNVYDDVSPAYCQPFALKGEICGNYISSDYLIECDPELYCYYPKGHDSHYYYIGGFCWSPGKHCKDVSDCEFTEEWCDMTDGLCKPRLPQSYFCDPNVKKQCQKRLECIEILGGTKPLFLCGW